MKSSDRIKISILDLVNAYYIFKKDEEEKSDKINYAGRVYDNKELLNLVDSALDFWLTHGKWCDGFECNFSDYIGAKYSLFVNSGSSANLLAFSALTSPQLKERQVKRGDEVITTACCFPTTVAPIVQYGAVPVFVDVDLETLNVDVTQLEKALTSKTKAVMLAHTLGNPFNIDYVSKFCDDNNLWLISDECDALGSTFKGEPLNQYAHISTHSFYPAHHITTGEGGMVSTHSPMFKDIMKSIRDWGRDCSCDSGEDNKCGRRFKGHHGDLPEGYDHKYVYSHFGYNLKATEMQGAIGVSQLKKVEYLNSRRRENFEFLYNELKELDEYFHLPKAIKNSDPCWFGFSLTLKDNVKFTRNEITKYLEDNGIQTRNVFSGNIIKHPCFTNNDIDYRIIGGLENTDKIMNDTFWVGIYAGLTNENLIFIVEKIKKFTNNI